MIAMRVFAALFLLVVIAATPLPQTTWLGVSIGETESDVFAKLGQAGRLAIKDGDGAASYTVDHGNGTLDVFFRKGYVQKLQLRSDIFSHAQPTLEDTFGLKIGDTTDTLKAKRGTGTPGTDSRKWPYWSYGTPDLTWTYYLTDGGVVKQIMVGASDASIEALPPTAFPTTQGGTSFDDAILNAAADESSGARNEYWTILNLRCLNGGGLYREVQQKLVVHGDKKYDVLHLKCYRSEEERDLYFDITPFFGKL